MGEPRRIQTTDAIYLVTNSTVGRQPFFAPSEPVNAIIRNNLAWAAARRGIDLYLFSFLPDCFFMLVSAPNLNLGRFMGDFQGLTARQINRERGRTGRFFAKRYDSSQILGNNAIIEEIGRILSVHVEREQVGPDGARSLSSLPLHETGEALVGEREDREEYRNIKRANPGIADQEARRLATTTYKVELAKFAFWQHETHRDYHRKVCEKARSHAEQPRLSLVDGPDRPDEVSRRDRPVRRLPKCITTSPTVRRDFLKRADELNFRYATASAALRRGRSRLKFPRGMIPPHRPWAVGSPLAPSGLVDEYRRKPRGMSDAA